jgi:hypothetical protein
MAIYCHIRSTFYSRYFPLVKKPLLINPQKKLGFFFVDKFERYA